MPSWIKEKDGLVWYDEAFATTQTNQSPAQLAKKAKAGKLRRFKQRNGPYWYVKEEVEALREAYLKRSNAAKGRRQSDAALEARHTRSWHRDMAKQRKQTQEARASLGPGRVSAIAAHQERAMLREIEVSNAKMKKSGKRDQRDSD